VYEAHDYYLDLAEKEKKNYKKKLFQKLFLGRINGIICHQNILINLYKNHFKTQNYLMARTGIKNINRYNFEEISSKKDIAYIGALGNRKDIETVFKSLKLLDNKIGKLIIIGGTNDKQIDYYKSLAADIGIKDKIKITGWVERKEIDEILKSVKIGLVPLKDNFFNRNLTSPMKIFNYFSHGIPVIGTNLPSIREILDQDYGLLYKVGDSNNLAKKIAILYDNERMYMNFVENIYNFSEKLLWSKRGNKILDFIEKI
jgi:glycosyltransferase involved in cell wall biosynthesis